MLRSAKLATPAAFVDWINVPESAAVVGLVPSESVTGAPGTRFKKASLTVIWTAGVMRRFVVVIVGCTEKTAVAGAAGVTLKEMLSTPGVPVTAACNVYVPDVVMLRFAKLATPLALVEIVVVPPSVAVSGPEAIDTVTEVFGTRFAKASLTVACTAGLMTMPAVAEVGWVVKATVAGAAGLTTADCEAVSAGLMVSVAVRTLVPAVINRTPFVKVCVPPSPARNV